MDLYKNIEKQELKNAILEREIVLFDLNGTLFPDIDARKNLLLLPNFLLLKNGRLKCIKNADKFVFKLKNDYNKKIGLVSNTSDNLFQKYSTNPIFENFDNITISGTYAKRKSKFLYLEAADNLKTNSDGCFVFEDTEEGVDAALDAGMKVCAVYNPLGVSNSERELIKSRTPYSMNNYGEVLNML